MNYKIVTENNTYIIIETENTIVIKQESTSVPTKHSLKDFLLDLDNSKNPQMILINNENKGEE